MTSSPAAAEHRPLGRPDANEHAGVTVGEPGAWVVAGRQQQSPGRCSPLGAGVVPGHPRLHLVVPRGDAERPAAVAAQDPRRAGCRVGGLRILGEGGVAGGRVRRADRFEHRVDAGASHRVVRRRSSTNRNRRVGAGNAAGRRRRRRHPGGSPRRAARSVSPPRCGAGAAGGRRDRRAVHPAGRRRRGRRGRCRPRCCAAGRDRRRARAGSRRGGPRAAGPSTAAPASTSRRRRGDRRRAGWRRRGGIVCCCPVATRAVDAPSSLPGRPDAPPRRRRDRPTPAHARRWPRPLRRAGSPPCRSARRGAPAGRAIRRARRPSRLATVCVFPVPGPPATTVSSLPRRPSPPHADVGGAVDLRWQQPVEHRRRQRRRHGPGRAAARRRGDGALVDPLALGVDAPAEQHERLLVEDGNGVDRRHLADRRARSQGGEPGVRRRPRQRRGGTLVERRRRRRRSPARRQRCRRPCRGRCTSARAAAPTARGRRPARPRRRPGLGSAEVADEGGGVHLGGAEHAGVDPRLQHGRAGGRRDRDRHDAPRNNARGRAMRRRRRTPREHAVGSPASVGVAAPIMPRTNR